MQTHLRVHIFMDGSSAAAVSFTLQTGRHVTAAVNPRDNPYGKKKLSAVVLPFIFRCQTTAEQYCMDMRMEVHFRTPCMQDTDIFNRSP